MISILLVGKIGCGKSATGNSILRKHVFRSILSASSVTKTVDKNYADFNGQEIKIVDCPGLLDTDCSPQESAQMVSNAIEQAICLSPEGYDAFLYVCEMRRFTQEDVAVMIQIKAFFGDDFFRKHCILSVTHADQYDKDEEDGQPIEEWIRNQEGPFAEARQECCDRVVTFDNVTEDKTTKDLQITRLLHYVDDIISRQGRYNKGYFELARDKREESIRKLNVPILSEESVKCLQLLTDAIASVNVDKDKSAQKILDDLNKQAEKLKETILDEEDHGKGKFEEHIDLCNSLQKAIDGKHKALEKVIDMENMKARSASLSKEEQARHTLEMNQLMKEKSEQDKINQSLESIAKNKTSDIIKDNVLFGLQIVGAIMAIASSTTSVVRQGFECHSIKSSLKKIPKKVKK